MIKLFGIPASNYTSAIRVALIEKGLSFEEDMTVMPNSEPSTLACSPMGKVPYIEVDGKYLCETNVIYDYLEDIQPEPKLYPDDPFEKAKVKEIIRVTELYLESPARRHLGAVVFGGETDKIAYEEVRPALEKGLTAFLQLAKFDPYVCGSEFSFADISSYFHILFTNLHTKAIYDWDITEAYPEIGKFIEFISQRDSISDATSLMNEQMTQIINDHK